MAAALVAVAVGAAPPAAAATGERIVFTSDRDGNWELYAMNADGSSPTRLTFDPRDDFGPTTPARGARIAFVRGRFTDDPPSDREDDWVDVYVMDADGSNVKRLTRDTAPDYSPSFSPDGSKIAFASRGNIHVMNADGSGRVNLTGHAGTDGSPTWSADGTRIAFARGHPLTPSSDIYVMNADGSAPARLTTAGEPDFEPAWSPDGRRIAFTRDRVSEPFVLADYEVFVINADGSGETQLTDTPPRPTGVGLVVNPAPSWSPDGTRIAFPRHDAGAGSEIYVMNADGSGPRALTRNSAQDLDPHFAPVPTAAPGSAPLTGRTRLRPRRVTIAGRARCRRRSRRILVCSVLLRGRVVRAAGPRASCAGGRVTATLRFGRRRVATVRTRTARGCTYRARKRFTLRTARRVRRLSVAARFGGNDFFSPRAGGSRTIRVRPGEG